MAIGDLRGFLTCGSEIMNSSSDTVLALSKVMSRGFEHLTVEVLENLRTSLDEGRKLVNCSDAGLLVPSGDGSTLTFLLSVNSRAEVPEILAKIQVPCDRSLAGCVFNTGQMIATANPEDFYAEVDRQTGLTTSVYLAVPLIQNNQILGVVTFVNRPEGQPQLPFNESEIDAGTRLATLLGVGFRNWQRLELQQRLFGRELALAARHFGGSTSWNDFSYGQPPVEAASPMEQSLAILERLAPREQDLAARLLQALCQTSD